MTQALIQVPARARRGEVIEIRALIAHPMETGLRPANSGGSVPRHLIEDFRCTLNGTQVFRARLFSAITANPYLAFFTRIMDSGLIECVWTDDRGERHSASARIEVQ